MLYRCCKDDILDIEALASLLLENLSSLYPQALEERYKIDTQGTGFELLENVGRKGGMLVSGGEVNTERAAITVFGRIQKRQAWQAYSNFRRRCSNGRFMGI